MERLPGAVFVIDPKREELLVKEANRLKIPVVALTDTNCDPEVVDYVIPGNDDAIRSISLISRLIADAIVQARGEEAVSAATDRCRRSSRRRRSRKRLRPNRPPRQQTDASSPHRRRSPNPSLKSRMLKSKRREVAETTEPEATEPEATEAEEAVRRLLRPRSRRPPRKPRSRRQPRRKLRLRGRCGDAPAEAEEARPRSPRSRKWELSESLRLQSLRLQSRGRELGRPSEPEGASRTRTPAGENEER